jgi:hypothetical protein
MNRDDGVAAVVLAPEHLLDFSGVDLARQSIEAFTQLGERTRIALLGPFDENRQVVTAALQGSYELTILFEPAASLKQSLRALLVLPEVRRRDLRLNLFQLFVWFSRLKDSSADQPPV